MATKSLPRLDWGQRGVGANREYAAPAERVALELGQFTVNQNIVPTARLPFDRRAVIREIWFSADAVLSDANGTLLIDVQVNDVSEGSLDLIVDDFDCEAQLTAANKAVKATFAAETSELERTVDAGDVLNFRLINNSAEIDQNGVVTALVIYQVLDPLPLEL